MSHAEQVRELLTAERTGALATHAIQYPGFPFASVMPYALSEDGSPFFLISSMAVHTKNLSADSRASLLVTATGGDARATLLGSVIRDDRGTDRDTYLARHPEAKQWIAFGDFAFFRLDIKAIYFVAGFGSMGWVKPEDYLKSNRV